MNEPLSLYFEEYGRGIPVILLHGFPLDHTIWNPIIPILKNKARLILPDLRGHGQSPAPLGVYSMLLLAEDILNLMDRLNIAKAILVGHSMGGYISFAFGRAFPERLAGLGLIATQAGADSPERYQGRLDTAEAIRQKGTQILAENMASRLTSIPGQVGMIRNLILKTNPTGAIGALLGIAEREDANEWLTEISVPTVIVAGETDPFAPPEKAQMMAEKIRHAQLMMFPHVNHMPMMEAPQQVAEALEVLVNLVQKESVS